MFQRGIKCNTLLEQHHHTTKAHSSSRIMRTYHTHFGIPLGTIPGWWDFEKKNMKPLLPNYLQKDISHNLLRSISCLRLSSHNFRVETQWHQGNRCPYELRICNKCDWHTVQDEEHIILDCPSEDLAACALSFSICFLYFLKMEQRDFETS